jgi:hypothetical protein
VRHRIIAVDPNESRRAKMQKIYDVLPSHARGQPENEFIIADIPDAPKVVQAWGQGGCRAVLEVLVFAVGARFGWCSRDRRRSSANLQP